MQLLWVHRYNSHVISGWQTTQHFLTLILWLLHSFQPFFLLPWGFLNLRGGGTDIPLKVENSTITVLNTLTVIYKHNCTWLRAVWCHRACSSSKTTVVPSFLGTTTFSLMSCDQVYNTQGRVPSCGMGIKSNQKLVLYPVNRMLQLP